VNLWVGFWVSKASLYYRGALGPHGRGITTLGFVIIPFDYDQLSDDQKKSIVPICIASVDRFGRAIAPIWFEEGVAPVQNQLRGLARHKLGDVCRVSELAEITVHKLWERHGEDAGILPWRRVLARAVWEARDLTVGGSLWRMRHTVPLEMWALDLGIYGSDMTEPEEIYARGLLIELIERRIEEDQRADIREIFAMLRQGYTWDEVAERLGNEKSVTLKKRFWRWIKRNFRQEDCDPSLPPRKHMPPPYRPGRRRMP
jgi:hypothetical protein